MDVTDALAKDAAVDPLRTYAQDGYAMQAYFSWQSSQYTTSDNVGFCIHANGFGASCVTLEHTGALSTIKPKSYWVPKTDNTMWTGGAQYTFQAGDEVTSTTPGFSGTWACGEVTENNSGASAFMSVYCYRYLPQIADTYTKDYRFAPADSSSFPTAPTYTILQFLSSKSANAEFVGVQKVLTGATTLSMLALTSALATAILF